jgi:NADPH-dependent 2,4-dienoyl-CoA reductase/sulfur reductase-like enzyme/rhodanese-related sulfurtransferase
LTETSETCHTGFLCIRPASAIADNKETNMRENILIVGGVALGPKAACRCKRLNPEADVTLVDENRYISYGGCGIPYYVSGEVNNLDDLRATPYHAIRDAEFFRVMKGVTVRTRTRALAVDRAAKKLLIWDLAGGREENLPYDKLLLATGARPRIPRVEGRDLDGVFSLTRLEAAEAIRSACRNGAVNSAVVVGGGFIGLEAAVALSDMWGVKVSVVEMADQLLPGVLSPDLARMASHDCASHGVDVFTAEKVVRLTGKDRTVKSVVTEKREIPCELVIFAAGFVPNGDLAKAAGLAVTSFGAVIVDEHMRASDASIYAGGDCASVKNIITGKNGYLPLGSMANRQGRVIGTNLAGGSAIFPGYVGTWAVKLFSLSFCGAGLTAENARKEGFDAVGVSVEQLDRAHFYPEKSMMSLTLVADRNDGRVIGIQGAGPAGDALKARIDAVAGVLQYAKPTVEDISNLEVGYSPPFAAAMDIVNAVANVTENVLAGRFKPVTAGAFMELWNNRDKNRVFFIDARPAAAGKNVEARQPDWHAIPLEEIGARIAEIPRDRPVAVICNTGLRSYDGVLVLARHGITDVVNTMGGMQAALKMGLQP